MQLRISQLQKLKTLTFDVLVVGGGINGAVSASALSHRGATTALIDARDFAGVSSQQSSNLTWGGVKYMESLEFGLVRKLCASRNHLLRSFPSSVQEIRFLAAHEPGFRHSLLKLYAGTWLYWLIGNCFTKRPRLLPSAKVLQQEEPIMNGQCFDGGLEYSDAFLIEHDARFVFQFVRSAMDYGCVAANYVESKGAQRGADGLWCVTAVDKRSGEEFPIRARALINACGAFVDEHNAKSGQSTKHKHIFSKGVHLIVDRLTPIRRTLTFFADDGRLFFAIPFGNKTCVGTTDTRVESPMPYVTEEDRDFILANINKRLSGVHLTRKDIIDERCGVRPLAVQGDGKGSADWFQLSRKHVIECDMAAGHMSIFGGKLTDCINVGEEVCAAIQRMQIALPYRHRNWFGEPDASIRMAFLHQCDALNLDHLAPSATGEKQGERLWRLYGEHAFGLLEQIRMKGDSAAIPVEGTDYMACEYRYVADREMVVSLEDFLRRRTKIEQTLRAEALRRSRGLRQACELLFGAGADDQYEAYFKNGQRYSDGERRVIGFGVAAS